MMASSSRREEISLEPRVLRWARERSALEGGGANASLPGTPRSS
jgi:hypothetical protein